MTTIQQFFIDAGKGFIIGTAGLLALYTISYIVIGYYHYLMEAAS
jgi:hypothetical protein